MRKLRLAIVSLLFAACAFAEGTRTWVQSSFEDFEKGTAKGVAINSNGSIGLAPSFKAISTTPSTYIWSLAADAQDNVYVAAGAPARVYRITPDGEVRIIFEPAELQVQSLVVDRNGTIYAATSPDGKVYKIERKASAPKTGVAPERKGGEQEVQSTIVERAKASVDLDWSSSVYFDPKTKYIWALALSDDGRLYVATGDRGEIFRIEKDGTGKLFFKSDEAHIRAVALDQQGNLIAGSDGSGLVYRISPAGEGFVLYSAAKKEITALATDSSGNIYAAAVGEKRSGNTQPVPAPGTSLPLAPTATASGAPGSQPQQQQTVASAGAPTVLTGLPPVLLPGPNIGGTDVYKIASDGSPSRLWTSATDVVYALGIDQKGELLVGTGNRGRIFSIRNDQEFTDLVKASATQITGFAKAPNGGLYVSASNLGKVFLLGGSPDTEGTFESDVFDARIFSRWGRAEVRAQGAFELWARSGNVDNPDRNWSAWKQVDLAREAPMAVPAARFVQWRVVMRPGQTPPRVESVLLNYLPKNVSPNVDDVDVLVGWRAQTPPRIMGENATGGGVGSSRPDPSPTREKGSISVKWSARDENDDQLTYSIYYRGDGENNWKLLKNNLLDRYYSFDSGLLPDGGYTLKVVASDAPSHTPEEALTDERESNRFEVDTTPPQVQNLNAAVEGDQLHVTFRAVDGFSAVRRAEYSVDAGEWQYVEPIGQLSDYRVENYDFATALPGMRTPTMAEWAEPLATSKAKAKRVVAIAPPPAVTGEHLIVVRVYDKFENVGVAKTVIRGK